MSNFVYQFVRPYNQPVYPNWNANNKKYMPIYITYIKPTQDDLIVEFGVGGCNEEGKKQPASTQV